MKRTWTGLPDSKVLLPAVKARYSKEEADLLTGMPLSPKSISELATQKKTAPDELIGRLDALAQKGLVFRMKRGEERFFCFSSQFLLAWMNV
jgi:hypothetical protein